MKWRSAALVVLLVTLALVFMWRHKRHPPTRELITNSTASMKETPARKAQFAHLSSQERGEARAKRDALRAEIARVLASRTETAAAAATNPALTLTQPPRVYPPGHLSDRIGGRDTLVKYLNHGFMPLAQECIERAQEQAPALKGLLALSLETLSDEQLGAVVDVAEAAPNNEISNADLLECIRETAYSLRLPPPPTQGREKFVLTLPIEPAVDMGSR